MPNIFDDPTLAEKVRLIVERMYETLGNTVGMADKLGLAAKEGFDKSNQGLDDLSKDFDEFVDLAEDGISDMHQRWNRFTTDMKNSLRELADSPGGKFLLGDKSGGPISGKVGGLEGMGSMMKQMQGQIFQNMPMGGLIGLMLAGRQYQADADATGERARQIFRRVGDTARDEASSIGREIKDLELTISGAEGDVQAVFGAFAEGGIKAKAAFADVGEAIEGFGDKAYQVSYALDKMWGVAAGSNAKFAADLAGSTGANIKEMVNLTRQLGFEAANSGLSFTAFVGAMTQASNTMRMQRQDAKDTTLAFRALREASGSAFGVSSTSNFAGQTGASALGALAGNMASMQEGMRAVLGQRIGGKLGLDLSGTQAILAMHEGFRAQGLGGQDGSTKFLTTVMKEMKSFLGETMGSDRDKQFQFLTKVQGLDPQTALVFMSMKEDMGDINKLTQEQKEELNKVFTGLGAQQDPLQKLIKELTLLVGKIGEFVLTLLGAILRGALAIGSALMEGFGGDWAGAWKHFSATSVKIGDILASRAQGIVDTAGMAGSDLVKVLEPLWLGEIPFESRKKNYTSVTDGATDGGVRALVSSGGGVGPDGRPVLSSGGGNERRPVRAGSGDEERTLLSSGGGDGQVHEIPLASGAVAHVQTGTILYWRGISPGPISSEPR